MHHIEVPSWVDKAFLVFVILLGIALGWFVGYVYWICPTCPRGSWLDVGKTFLMYMGGLKVGEILGGWINKWRKA